MIKKIKMCPSYQDLSSARVQVTLRMAREDHRRLPILAMNLHYLCVGVKATAGVPKNR